MPTLDGVKYAYTAEGIKAYIKALRKKGRRNKETDEKVEQELQPITIPEDKLGLTKDEITFMLAKLAQMDFKGVEIELVYNLIIKLQERFKLLSSK